MSSSSKTVVVAEDDALIRMAAADELVDAGYEVIEAETAGEALQALREQEVFLLFTDVNMPGEMDGLALARLVRGRWPRTYVVVVTADESVRTEATKDIGLLFRKPYHLNRVLAQVEALVAG